MQEPRRQAGGNQARRRHRDHDNQLKVSRDLLCSNLMKKFLKVDMRSSSRIVFRDSKGKLEQRSRSRGNRARSKVSIR